MNKIITSTVLSLLICLISYSKAFAQNTDAYVYKPKSQDLYNTIVHMDSVYFNAYNNCDMAKQADIFADSIEFYHDGGGLERSKQALLNSIQKNICGKVTRVLVKGSIEVYPIPGYGAVEIALHRFINHSENDHLSQPDRFIIVWRLRKDRNQKDKWQMTRIISLHMEN
jgi:hypothetical protein